MIILGWTMFAFSDEYAEFGISHPISQTIVTLATNEEYDSALVLIDSLTTMLPDNPYGYLLTATILSGRAVDFEDEIDDLAILAACDEVRRLCLADNHDSSPLLLYYLGMADIYHGIVLQRQGALFSYFKRILKAGHYLERAVELDSTCWDVYYGLGMYQYYTSSRAGLLRSIGIISDKRKEGIHNIQTAIDRGTLTTNAARNSLAWVELENKNYEEAVRRSRESLEIFPNRRAFMWCLGKALAYSERWTEMIPVFTALLESVRSESRNNRYNEVSCLYFLTKANFELGNWSDVLNFSKEALALSLTPKVMDRKKNDIKQLKQMKKTAQKHIQN